ncbi:GNAT family N-acetyltransferase [Fictibacillus barbaricus]|uniref:Acetyltransferase n=1 Tax=Fictibacillus barbaricus TaxID=182136 RepID=A0ABU1TW72_9BACL|nr:N-acetyltransferase [Fictibacillus barbaricus]MDR7071424.1 putative acetyltransferase [Fictibacillus barbaricus]
MIKIRHEQPSDLGAIQMVNNLAFKGENEGRLVDAIRKSEFFIPELSLVAVKNDIIGHILFSGVSIETETSLIPTLALAPMAVHPEYQNQAIGSLLVKEGLKKAKVLGFEHVVVLGHPSFYPKFGFVSATQKGIESPLPVPEEVFMVYELKSGSLNGLKGKVKYPPAFDAVS